MVASVCSLPGASQMTVFLSTMSVHLRSVDIWAVTGFKPLWLGDAEAVALPAADEGYLGAALLAAVVLVQAPAGDGVAAAPYDAGPAAGAHGVLVVALVEVAHVDIAGALLEGGLPGPEQGLHGCGGEVPELVHGEEATQVEGRVGSQVVHQIAGHASGLVHGVVGLGDDEEGDLYVDAVLGHVLP